MVPAGEWRSRHQGRGKGRKADCVPTLHKLAASSTFSVKLHDLRRSGTSNSQPPVHKSGNWDPEEQLPIQDQLVRDFPCGPVVTNLPCNPGDARVLGTKIPRVVEQLNLCATTSVCALLRKVPCAATKTRCSQIIKKKKKRLKVLVPQTCVTFCDPMDSSWPATLSMEFSRQEYWSG